LLKIDLKKLKELFSLFRRFLNNLFDDRIGFYAASMSWSTIFFIIPLLVIILSITIHTPFFNHYYIKIHSLIQEALLPTNSKVIMEKLDEFVRNANKMGYIGFGYITIAAIFFFKDYDYIVNDIFETPKRKAFEAIKTYFFLLIFIPFALGLSFWLTSIITSFLDRFNLGFILNTIINLIPFLIIWGIFYISYQLSPQEPVSPKSAAISSFLASLIWYLAKWLFLLYISFNKTYSSIYGSVSILLFFFLWIFISWAIFLHGLRFCYLLDKGLEKIEKKETKDF